MSCCGAVIELARLGQLQGRGVSGEQLDPQGLLQPLQASAEGGLGEVELLGGPGDAAALGDGQKVFVLLGDQETSPSYHSGLILTIS